MIDETQQLVQTSNYYKCISSEKEIETNMRNQLELVINFTLHWLQHRTASTVNYYLSLVMAYWLISNSFRKWIDIGSRIASESGSALQCGIMAILKALSEYPVQPCSTSEEKLRFGFYLSFNTLAVLFDLPANIPEGTPNRDALIWRFNTITDLPTPQAKIEQMYRSAWYPKNRTFSCLACGAFVNGSRTDNVAAFEASKRFKICTGCHAAMYCSKDVGPAPSSALALTETSITQCAVKDWKASHSKRCGGKWKKQE